MEDNQRTKGALTAISWTFFISVIAQMIGNTIAGSYLSFFMTERMMITPIMMGSVLLVARMGDLVLGMVTGAIVQKTQFRWGQYRSWLLMGPFIVSLGTTMLFVNSGLPLGVKYAQVVIGYLLYGGAMSFMQISQNGMLAKIAGPDMQARMTISSKVVQGQNTGRLLTSLITVSLITFFDRMDNVDGYTVTQLLFITIGIIGQMFLFRGTAPYESYDPNFKTSGSGGIKLTTMIGQTLKNSQLVILMIGDTARATVMMTLASLNAYYFNYVAGNMGMMTTYLTVTSVTSLLSSFLLSGVAKKVGKRNAGRIAGVICSICYFCLGFFAGTNPWLYIIFCAIAGAGLMVVTSVAATLYMDCGEYQLYQTGQDNRTFTMSMFGVTTKLGFVFSSVILSALLEVGGYNAGALANPGLFVRMIGIVFGGIYLVYTSIMFFGYRITEEKSKEYAEANHKMLAERAAAAAAASRE